MWIWWLTGDARLRRAERDALDRTASRGELRVSAISLWEAQMLHAKRRLHLPMPFAEWLSRATDTAVIGVAALDRDVVIALDGLPDAFNGDPADRVIVATARAHAWPLASHDRVIRRSRLVKIWKP